MTEFIKHKSEDAIVQSAIMELGYEVIGVTLKQIQDIKKDFIKSIEKHILT